MPGPEDLARLRRLMEERMARPVAGAKAAPRPRRAAPRPPADDAREADDVGAWAPGEVWSDTGAWEETGRPAGRDARRRWWEEESPARPIRVEGGLAARTRRGRIGGTWWSQRFLAAIEATMEGGRPGRGRAYARQGQVLRLAVTPGVIEAAVQGSRPDPYRVRLTMPVVADADWERVVASLAARAGYAAQMLAGELPHEMEEVFAAEGCSLFPAPGARMVTECTCPDWANPCKHVAAVCYLVAESFDDDPFAVLAWRGRSREQVLAELRRLRAEAADAATGTSATADRAAADRATAGRTPAGTGGRRRDSGRHAGQGTSLAADVGDWWRSGGMLSEVKIRPEPASDPVAVVRQLPGGVLVVGGYDMSAVLSCAYPKLVRAAARRATGDA